MYWKLTTVTTVWLQNILIKIWKLFHHNFELRNLKTCGSFAEFLFFTSVALDSNIVKQRTFSKVCTRRYSWGFPKKFEFANGTYLFSVFLTNDDFFLVGRELNVSSKVTQTENAAHDTRQTPTDSATIQPKNYQDLRCINVRYVRKF